MRRRSVAKRSLLRLTYSLVHQPDPQPLVGVATAGLAVSVPPAAAPAGDGDADGELGATGDVVAGVDELVWDTVGDGDADGEVVGVAEPAGLGEAEGVAVAVEVVGVAEPAGLGADGGAVDDVPPELAVLGAGRGATRAGMR
ncbi:MAG: hypothetical protein QOE89_4073, partial [Pseudonocardiales bacterium]|nr:hypothetical protein [Pseudonocardiales bacterium]